MYIIAQFATLASLLLSLFISINGAMGQDHNVTVVETDPSITYEGPNTGDAPICKFDANGEFLPGEPGCYLVANNCTSSAAMGQSPSSAASFKFQGSAIYINSLLDSLSPIYTVTLDGNSTDVDGFRPSAPFICSPLFSATNLDPSVEHTIRLSIKGPSPNRNTTIDPTGSATIFSLINFMFTVPDSNSTGTNTTASSTTSSSTSSSTTSNTTATASSGSSTTPTTLFMLMFSLVGLGLLAGH
ncbi:hypothetical protein BYT27DRAFT_7146961 [Phlegmacium glaucopus]|nr:hypothetical protein BYT27DRAFT_7146961 [Phlegmacium glaucopus]